MPILLTAGAVLGVSFPATGPLVSGRQPAIHRRFWHQPGGHGRAALAWFLPGLPARLPCGSGHAAAPPVTGSLPAPLSLARARPAARTAASHRPGRPPDR